MEFLNGVRIGEYKLDVDNVINEIREKCIEGRKNYTAIALYRGEIIADEILIISLSVKNLNFNTKISFLKVAKISF